MGSSSVRLKAAMLEDGSWREDLGQSFHSPATRRAAGFPECRLSASALGLADRLRLAIYGLAASGALQATADVRSPRNCRA